MGEPLTLEKRGVNILSHFDLKVIAVILMTVDHIALFFLSPTSLAYAVMRGFGRLAFPLFAFMAVEGTFKSHNNLIYALKLLILGAVIDVTMVLIDNGAYYTGNSMMELGLGVLGLSLITKKKWYSVLAIIPFTIMVLADFSFFPIRVEYGTLGLIMMLTFFIGKLLTNYYFDSISSKLHCDYKMVIGVNKVQTISNVFSISMLVFTYLVFFMLWSFFPELGIFTNFFSFQIEQYGILASVIILFYSGRQGFNNKIVNWAFYIYYPLHMIVLALIAIL